MAKREKTGGRKKGSKKGSKNRRTALLDAGSRGKLPLDYMLNVMLAATADKERRDNMHT